MIYDYSYNYGFLAQWMAANGDISKRQILQALGSTDYQCFNRWLNGEIPMPVSLIMKFCNTYGVPLSNFFRDKNATVRFIVEQPKVNDQIEPNGGYPDFGHKQGRQAVNPKAEEVMESNDPLATERHKKIAASDASMAVETLKLTMQHREEIIEERHKKEIANMKKDWAEKEKSIGETIRKEESEERKVLLDIIARQTTQIAELTKRLMAAEVERMGYDMAAEEPSVE